MPVSDSQQMCQTFVPLLRKNGRIVNVSSTGSSLDGYSKDIQKRLWNPKMTLPNLDQMMNDYQVTAVEPFGYSILGISEQRN